MYVVQHSFPLSTSSMFMDLLLYTQAGGQQGRGDREKVKETLSWPVVKINHSISSRDNGQPTRKYMYIYIQNLCMSIHISFC